MTTPNFSPESAPETSAPQATVPAPTPPTPDVPVIRRERKRPRFVERPKENDQIISRSDLLANKRNGGKPAFSRQRNIAGDLPRWNPEPPGEIVIQRVGATS
ncbi:MAG: hypothetical protein Q4A92_04040 [Corynebacterium sp.]|nr:hypothetical protein [Corynebacterium sp.]